MKVDLDELERLKGAVIERLRGAPLRVECFWEPEIMAYVRRLFETNPDLIAELRELRLLVREKAKNDAETYAPRQCRCDFCDAARRLGLLEDK